MIALGIPQSLDNDLLCRLGENATEPGRIHLDADFVADLGLGIIFCQRHRVSYLALAIRDDFDHFHELKELDLAEFLAVASLDFLIQAVPLARSLNHRLFEGADNVARIDALVFGDLINFTLQRRDEHVCSSQSLDPDSFVGSHSVPPQAEPFI